MVDSNTFEMYFCQLKSPSVAKPVMTQRINLLSVGDPKEQVVISFVPKKCFVSYTAQGDLPDVAT